MLDHRMNFGRALRASEGYEMDHAIGTSYSLSLEALMFIPITLFFGEDFNPSEKVITSEMFEALTKVPEHVQLFCQRGKIAKPGFYHNILAFWEKSVEQIQMDSHLQSFHPKVWLVRYRPFDKRLPIKYKFLCTSRNLTLSRDWDMAVQMDGEVKKTTFKKNKPLFDFVSMLNDRATKKINPLVLEEIMNIEFDLDQDQLDYAFHPIGFNGYKNPLLVKNKKQEKLLAISPFIDVTTLKEHCKNSNEFYLFSNAYDLSLIDTKKLLDKDKTFMFNPLLDQAFLAEPDSIDEDDEQTDNNINGNIETDESYNPSMNLHAKFYIEQNEHLANWFIGSANCTDPAKERNIEFLTEIKFDNPKATVEEVVAELTQPLKGQGLFIPYLNSDEIAKDENKQSEAMLRKLIFDLAALNFKGSTTQKPAQRFDLEITVSTLNLEIPANCSVAIVPLSANIVHQQLLEPKQQKQVFVFKDFEESMLTPFILCTINYGEGFVKQLVLDIEIEFDDSRMKKIFKSIISNQEKLFLYLSAILSKEETVPLLDLAEANSKKTKGTSRTLETMPLYEKLLVAASRDPNKIKIAKKTIEILTNETDENGNLIISKAFEEFFDVFKPYADEV
ncbi:MAG: hypothetical protein R2730_00220 [Chitinophagales bacterium]